ncbi:OmpA family protein [Marinobacterium sp. 3-1745]|uniref:OmpA family protein n=2 Tax=Marinobacterium marinum TaxID=2756129 RepID=A0A7W1WY74_9GAMM|nr:OmpA family protein [Marinobacterium marinum]
MLAACQMFPSGRLNSEQVAVLKKHGFSISEAGWEFGLAAKVLFEFDSDIITPGSRDKIEDITRDFLEVGISGLTLEGHTDKSGDPDYNLQLSERRAAAVADVMIGNGMPRENVIVLGLGDRKPVASNSTLDGRMQNRRVTIIVAN